MGGDDEADDNALASLLGSTDRRTVRTKRFKPPL
jgi:hypothetical protein